MASAAGNTATTTRTTATTAVRNNSYRRRKQPTEQQPKMATQAKRTAPETAWAAQAMADGATAAAHHVRDILDGIDRGGEHAWAELMAEVSDAQQNPTVRHAEKAIAHGGAKVARGAAEVCLDGAADAVAVVRLEDRGGWMGMRWRPVLRGAEAGDDVGVGRGLLVL